jgi:hypothetical protein
MTFEESQSLQESPAISYVVFYCPTDMTNLQSGTPNL